MLPLLEKQHASKNAYGELNMYFIKLAEDIFKTLCDNILECLKRNVEILRRFTNDMTLYGKTVSKAMERLSSQLGTLGLEKKIVTSSPGLTSDLYMKTPCTLLQVKVRKTPLEVNLLKPIFSDMIGHPKNAETVKAGFSAIEAVIRKQNRNVSWNYNATGGTRSAV